MERDVIDSRRGKNLKLSLSDPEAVESPSPSIRAVNFAFANRLVSVPI